jgi:hypothetical protein
MVFPLDLAADYSPNVIPIALGWTAMGVAGVVLTLGGLAGAWVAWRRPPLGRGSESARAVGFGLVWFLVAISPISNVVFLSGVLLAERTLYLPSVGIAVALAWLLVRLARERRRTAIGVTVAVVALSGVRSWMGNPMWQSTDTVFLTMIRDYPYSGRAQWALGERLFAHDDVARGMIAYRTAVSILGPHYPLLFEIGERLRSVGNVEGAGRVLQAAWRLRPDLAPAPELLAVMAWDRRDAEETLRWARRSMEARDEDDLPYLLAARAYGAEGRWAQAAEAGEGAMARGDDDGWWPWYSLAYLRARAGDTDGARAALDSARGREIPRAAERQMESVLAGDTLMLPLPQPAGEGREGADTLEMRER